jgi:hypothetical protein
VVTLDNVVVDVNFVVEDVEAVGFALTQMSWQDDLEKKRLPLPAHPP